MSLTVSRTRTVLVLSQGPALAARLRERVQPGFAVVRSASPELALEAFSEIKPWPWMVIGELPELPQGLADTLHKGFPLIWWIGPRPAGLPASAKVAVSWREPVFDIERMGTIDFAGLRLAPARGVRLPAGRYIIRVEELEAALGAYPGTVGSKGGDSRRVRKINELLETAPSPWRLSRLPDGIRLQPHPDSKEANN